MRRGVGAGVLRPGGDTGGSATEGCLVAVPWSAGVSANAASRADCGEEHERVQSGSCRDTTVGSGQDTICAAEGDDGVGRRKSARPVCTPEFETSRVADGPIRAAGEADAVAAVPGDVVGAPPVD